MSIGRFYGGIFALIWSPATDRYLLLKRSRARDFASGIWECVAGRVDQGEGFAQALHREVYEELGVDVQYEFMIGTTHFYRGSKIPENELIGVLCYCSLDRPEAIRISLEHSEYRWVNFEEFEQMHAEDPLSTHWIKDVIYRAEAIRQRISPELKDYFRQAGLEIA